jgi:hypothetical protein
LPDVVALALAIESPLHAMLIWPMVVSGVPSLTKMKFLLVTGDPDAVGEGVGVTDADVVGVGLGEADVLVVPVPLTIGTGEIEMDNVGVGDGVGDGETLGTTAPPTACPSRHT